MSPLQHSGSFKVLCRATADSSLGADWDVPDAWITATAYWPDFRHSWFVDYRRCWIRLRDWHIISDHVNDVLVRYCTDLSRSTSAHWTTWPTCLAADLSVLPTLSVWYIAPVKLTIVVNRTFPSVGPRTWNDLPDDVSPHLVSDSKRIFSRNPSRDYFLDWTPLDFCLVDLVFFIIDWLIENAVTESRGTSWPNDKPS